MSVIFTRGKTPKPGQAISAKTLGGMSNAATAGRGAFGGNLFGLRNSGGAGGFIPRLKNYVRSVTQVAYGPFHMFSVYNSVTLQMDITFYPGSIEQQLPSNIFDTLNCANSGIFYATLDVNTDGQQVTNSSLSISSTAPSPMGVQLGGGPSSFKVLIGIISDGVSYQIWSPEQNMNATLVEVLRSDKSSPAPNTLPYQSYYKFEVTGV